MMEALHIVNGEVRDSVSVQDRGFSYGDGCFETIAVRDGRALLWDAHMERLQTGCRRLGIDWNFGEPELDAACRQLTGDAGRAVVRITVTRGAGGRGYRPPVATTPTWAVSAYPWPEGVAAKRQQGITLTWCHTPLACNPALAGIKHLNRLEQVLARGEWGEEYEEGLMCDLNGNVMEGTMSNVFFIEDGILKTPALAHGGVNGIMRERVLQAARQEGLQTEAGRYTRDVLAAGEALFVTNSVIGIWPVIRFHDKHYSLHPAVTRLQQVTGDAVA